jgi:hypothetical protein
MQGKKKAFGKVELTLFRWIIIMLEYSQALHTRPSEKGSLKVNALKQWLETGLWNFHFLNCY